MVPRKWAQAAILLISIQKIFGSCSSLVHRIQWLELLWHSSVLRGKFRVRNFNYALNSSFHIDSNSLSTLILTFDGIYSELLTASLNKAWRLCWKKSFTTKEANWNWMLKKETLFSEGVWCQEFWTFWFYHRTFLQWRMKTHGKTITFFRFWVNYL